MLWVVVAALIALWLFGLLLRIASGLIHLLLVVALVVIVYRLVTTRRVL